MIDTIVFDFDGVILESADIKTTAFRKLFGEDYPDRVQDIVDYHKKNMGISRFVKFRHIYQEIIRMPLTEERETELGERFSAIILKEVLAAPMVTGVEEFLREYYEDYRFYIASGTPEDELKLITSERGLDNYFKGIYGAPKAKADIIFDIINACGLQPDEVVFVGDARSDKLAAEKTGVVFVARVHHDGNELSSCQYQIKDFLAFAELIKQF